MRDPYTVLGVPRGADPEQIRKEYKRLAKKFHPDLNKSPSAEERFKEVNSAYEVLGDEKKRKLYDQYGEASTRTGFNPQPDGWPGSGGFSGGGGVNMEDLLGSIFGAGSGQRPRKGADQRLVLPIDFMSTVTGAEREVRVRRPHGSDETVKVPIPAGAKDGGRVRLKGRGLPPRGGGPCGDLVIQLQVASHAILTRVGDNLEMEVPVTLREAMEGASVTVPTPTGDVKVNLPPGTPNGRRMRLKGKGIQKRAPGDLYLIIRPKLPKASEAALELLKALDEHYDTEVRSDLRI